MAGQPQTNSFEEYKKYLEDSIGTSDIPKPPRIMNPYNLFCFQRQAQQRAKGKINFIQLNKALAIQWKELSEPKKQYYVKVYQIRKREADQLKLEYQLLSNTGRSPTAYILYFRKKYPILSKANPDSKEQMITKMIAADWSNLDAAGRLPFQQDAKAERQRRNLSEEDKKQYIQTYQQKIKQFKTKLQQDKSKILKKYGVYTKVQIKKQKKDQRKQQKKNSEKNQPKKQNKLKQNVKTQPQINKQLKKQNDKQQTQIKKSQTQKIKQKEKQVNKKKDKKVEATNIAQIQHAKKNEKVIRKKQKQPPIKIQVKKIEIKQKKKSKQVVKQNKKQIQKQTNIMDKNQVKQKAASKIPKKTKLIKKSSKKEKTKQPKLKSRGRKAQKTYEVKIQPQQNQNRTLGRKKKQKSGKK